MQKEPSEVFYGKAFLKHFAIFTGKHPRWSLFNKVADLVQASNIIKKENPTQAFFTENFAIFLRSPLFVEHLCDQRCFSQNLCLVKGTGIQKQPLEMFCKKGCS